MVQISFVGSDLRHFDQTPCDVAWFPYFADERPLRGPLGLIDWRMRAYLSRQIVRGRARGKLGELLMTPGAPLLCFDKIMLFGLGDAADFSPKISEYACRRMLEVLLNLQARSCVTLLPGRSSKLESAATAVTILFEQARTFNENLEIHLVEDNKARREMSPIIEQQRRRARAARVITAASA